MMIPETQVFSYDQYNVVEHKDGAEGGEYDDDGKTGHMDELRHGDLGGRRSGWDGLCVHFSVLVSSWLVAKII